MNNSEPGSNFLDGKTLMAIGVMLAFWMGWQYYLVKKYPQPAKTQSEATVPPESSANDVSRDGAPVAAKVGSGERKNDEISGSTPTAEQLIEIENEFWSMQLSSRGMGFKSVVIKKFKDRKGQPVKIGEEINGRLPLETNLIGRSAPLMFEIEKVGEGKFIGRARSDGLEVVKTVEIDPSLYQVKSRVQVVGQSPSFMGLTTYMVDKVTHVGGASMFAPQTEFQELFVEGAEGKERIHFVEGTEETKSFNKVNVVAMGTQYFTQALIDQSAVLPEVKSQISVQQGFAVAALNFPILAKADNFEIKFTAFLGPKYLHLLKSVDESLASVVDFGFFSALGRPILRMLKWFYGWLGNFGVAIILLTILVRFLVLPFNIMSFRSMKAMQVIQPQIKALREKYQNDQNRLNQEMMALFKQNKVNPLGGCLPVLLQIPIFLALYQVLGHSIELYQAPFVLWIDDLSLKDPYFVLPVLMGITMFIQQKITPSTLDPVQAKVLMFMPVIFSFFMLALPSGLTLYIFVSTLFGIIQQLYLMKSTGAMVATNK